MSSPAFRTYELEERLGKRLLPSQRKFIFSPERESMISGGFGSGKSYALVTKGVVLSAAIPNNAGAFLCYRGTDVEKRLIPIFMEEVCPPQWIKSYNRNKRTVVLRNNSKISFEHLKDSTGGAGTGTRRIGANWGWFGLDQAEEATLDLWNALLSRLRLPRAPKKFAFGDMNPGGRDWLWEKFFQPVVPWPRDEENHALPLDGKFYQAVKASASKIGIAVNSEENRKSNSGFVDDSFFDNLLETYGEQWVERYVYGSFADFKGKMFPDFSAGLVDYSTASVHIIEDFPIPRNWNLVQAIDVGGDSPWAVCPMYSDERGNLILTNGFHNRTGRVSEVAAWIKRNTPWNESRTTFVIDPENRVATVELSDHGIYANPAIKDINPGLLRMESYLHVVKHRSLPRWYQDTQPQAKFEKFRGHGSPKMFVFKSANVIRKELDTCKWDPDKIDKMYKSSTARFDAVEAIRYGVMTLPQASKEAQTDDEERYRKMEERDPATAREWRAYDKKIAARRSSGKVNLKDADVEEMMPADTLSMAPPGSKYDWADE